MNDDNGDEDDDDAANAALNLLTAEKPLHRRESNEEKFENPVKCLKRFF